MAEQQRARDAAIANLDEQRLRVWCEMTQCLDRKTLMLIRCDKPNGTAAWSTLAKYYRSTERPRIQKTLTKLTSLRMKSEEVLADYFCRAEELQLDLREAGENVSDTMFIAMIMQGLPQEYETVATLLNHGEQKSYTEIKQVLTNFANNRPCSAGGSAFHAKTAKCYSCGKLGHKQSECRDKYTDAEQSGTRYGTQFNGPPKEVRTCFNCGKVGHIAKFCRSPRRETNGGDNGSSGGTTHYAKDESSAYSFMASRETVRTASITRRWTCK